MAKSSPENVVTASLGPAIGAAVAGGIGWLTTGLTGLAGSVIAAALSIISALAGIAFVLILRRYGSVLIACSSKPHSLERQEYNSLRTSLAQGNLATHLYTEWLTKTLNAVDRFFGDAELADLTLFPHAFGLKSPAPLWTAPAFDRCLLLAIVYPVATILVIWGISGHVGPAETALGLESDVSNWRRGLALALAASMGFAMRRIAYTAGWKSFAWFAYLFVIATAVSLTNLLTPSVAGVALLAGLVGVRTEVARSFAYNGTPTGAGIATVIVVAGVFFGIGTSAIIAIPSALAIIGVFAWLNDKAIEHQRQGIFLSAFLVIITLICLVDAYALSSLIGWDKAGPLLQFFGLLTFINAPFDWLSLGLTRALLRRGLERQGWWPYLYSFVDAALAAIIIAALAIAMVIGVQAFDELAVLGGGEVVLPLDELLDGLATKPSEPEYWWLYALLLSTMIPSLVNLAIGGASLVRGAPGVPNLLLKFIPATRSPTAANRAWIATVLTGQIFLGTILGIAAQVFLFWGIILYAMPKAGLSLLDMARSVADFDLPARIGRLAVAFL